MPVRKATLLCVDDDAQCLTVRRMLFEAYGFTVVSCTNPRQGLRLHQLKRFDAAVIDFQMPEMDGGVLAAKMKRARPDVPVVILSGLPYLPEGTPEAYDRFLCKTDSGFKVVKEIETLISTTPNDGIRRRKTTVRQRILAATGIAIGFAVEGVFGMRGRARRRQSPAYSMKNAAMLRI